MEEYTYDEKFEGNVLIVGRTGCGKTTFIQKLAQNKMFGNDIANVFWISKIFRVEREHWNSFSTISRKNDNAEIENLIGQIRKAKIHKNDASIACTKKS